MPRTKGRAKALPLAMHVFLHDHSKRHDDPENAEKLGRYRINMMENDTFAELGRKALQRFRQEQPEKGQLVEVDVIMDKDYYDCSLDDQLETLKDGEALHVFLTEPSSASSQEATPQTPSAKTKSKSAQSQKSSATPKTPKPTKSTPSKLEQQTPTSTRSLRPSAKGEGKAVELPPIHISSDSSSDENDCVIVSENCNNTPKIEISSDDDSESQEVASSPPKRQTPVPTAKNKPHEHKDPVLLQIPKKQPEAPLASDSSKSPTTLPNRGSLSKQDRQEPASSLSTALPPKTKSNATPQSQLTPSREPTSRSGSTKKDPYEVPSDDEGIIPLHMKRKLQARIQALQDDDVVPLSPLPKKTVNEQAASARKQASTPKAKVVSIKDSESSPSEESAEEVRSVARTPNSYLVKNTRGTHNVFRRKGNSAQPKTATNPPSSSGVSITRSSPCARDLPDRLGQHNIAMKKRLDKEAAAAAAAAEEAAKKKEEAEAKARIKRVSSRDAIDDVKKYTSFKFEPKEPIEIPDSFFEETDLSDDHLGDDIINGSSQLQSRSQSQSQSTIATPKPRFEGKRRHPTPTTSFTPINTLYPEVQEQPKPENTPGKTFGLNYPKHFRDRFSDAEQSDEDNKKYDAELLDDVDGSVGSEDERFYRGEILDEDGLPKAFREFSWKYKTLFVSLGDRGYTHVGDGPWEGLILNGRHRGKYVFGCEPPTNAQIAKGEKAGELRVQTNALEESDVEDDDDAEQIELPPCSLNNTTTPTPTPQWQGAQEAKVSDNFDTPSAADSEASSVMIRKQLEAECPPSNQQLGILMSSSPSRTPTARSKVAPIQLPSVGRGDASPRLSDDNSDNTPKPVSKLVVNNSGLSTGKKATIKKVLSSDEMKDDDDDETVLPPKPLAEITASMMTSEGDEDGTEGSQGSGLRALKYVLQESPRWLNSLTTIGPGQDSCKGPEQNTPTSSPKRQRQKSVGPEQNLPTLSPKKQRQRQRQKSEPLPSSAPPKWISTTPIPVPVIPTFRAATPAQTSIQNRMLNGVGSERKPLTQEPPKSVPQATATKFRSFTPEPPKSVPQATAPKLRSFFATPLRGIPNFPRPAPAGLKSVVDNPLWKKSDSVVQKQPNVPEAPQKDCDGLSGSDRMSPAASVATSSKSTSKKRRRRDSEDKYSEEPTEETPSRKKHKKKDKSARKHRHEKQQDGHVYDDEESITHDVRDSDSVVISEYARKDDEHKEEKKKRKDKYKSKHDNSLDDSTTTYKPAQVDEDSVHKKSKSTRKHRKSLDPEDTPSRKKRKHSHDDHVSAAAVTATNTPIPAIPPPPTIIKHDIVSSTPLIQAGKNDDGHKKGKPPPAFASPAAPQGNKNEGAEQDDKKSAEWNKCNKSKMRREKDRRRKKNQRRKKSQQRLNRNGGLST